MLAGAVLVAGCLSAAFISAPLKARSSHENEIQQDANKAQGGNVAAQHASGPFEVKLAPQGTPDKAEGSTLARMSLDKQYHGGLEATAKGEMLTAGTNVQGSAGYVAIERVTGTLNGRTGSFVLQHSGTLTRGAATQNITVVPDSGSGQLVGITGKLTVIIEGGKHSYEFEYTLPHTQ
jgi:autotransporter translocation and assembly factor TamB